MKQILIYFALSISIVAFCKCRSTKSEDAVSFEQIERVVMFPFQENLGSPSVIEMPCAGGQEFRIIDSLLWVSTSMQSNCWNVISLADMTVSAQWLNAGKGPFEFVMIPSIGQTSVYESEGTLFCSIPDYVRHVYYDVELNGSCFSDSLLGESIPMPDQNNQSVFMNKFSKDEIFNVSILPQEGKVKRTFYKEGKSQIVENLEILNQFSVDNLQFLGRLIYKPVINAQKHIVAEISNVSHQINIYSLLDSFKKTIAIDGMIDSFLSSADDQVSQELVIYRDIRGYENCFVVCQSIYGSELDEIGARLLFFDWEGNPLMELKTKETISNFDIDWNNNLIYIYDYEREFLARFEMVNSLDLRNNE